MTKTSTTNRFAILRAFLIACAAAVAAVSSAAAAQHLVALSGHVPTEIQHAANLGRAPADEKVSLSLMINVDQTLMNQTLEGLYGRGAPAQKHYLSSSAFAQRFGLAAKREQIKNFAQANGLSLDTSEDRPESMVVKVSGSAAAVEKAFNIHLNHYRGADGRVFRSHDTDPMIPDYLAPHLSAVVGLSTMPNVFRPHLKRAPASRASASPSVLIGATGQLGGMSPADIKSVYGLSGTALTGAGETLALVEFDGYAASDITIYEGDYALAAVPLVNVSVDSEGNNPSGTDGQVEVTLDIEMVAALAPGVTRMLIYQAPNNQQGGIDMDDKIATDNLAQVVSTSWGYPEEVAASLTVTGGSAYMTAENSIYQRLAVQGQSMYAASGDNGAVDDPTNPGVFQVDDPAAQPYVTGVGGTSLSGLISAPTETTWNNGGASGGGVSAVFPIPSFQQGLAGAASQTTRNVPDVALNADPNSSPYSIVVLGGPNLVGGTSAAAPLWAALTTLINQQRVAASKSTMGFANSVLYDLGTSTSSIVVYRDITLGNNNHYTAGPGYDNVTGFGSFKGTALIDAASSVVALSIQPELSNVYAYPNPWDTRKDTKRQMTIANLPDGASVKIFTVSGFWVKTLPLASGGSAVWDLTNSAGDRAASGLYFYLVTTSNAQTKGEIAIIK